MLWAWIIALSLSIFWLFPLLFSHLSQNKKRKGSLLVTRFPLESALGGEEKIHLLLARELKKKGIVTKFWGSCPHFQDLFSKYGFSVTRSFFLHDITSKMSILLSPFFVLSLFLQGLFWLPRFRIQGAGSIIMLSFLEKIILTPLALFFGYRIFWGHHAPLGSWFFRNPFFPVWKYFSQFVTILVPSEAMKTELGKVCDIKRIRAVHNAFFSSLLLPAIHDICGQKKEFSETNFWKEKGFSEEMLRDRICIGTACRLSPEKNLDAFLLLAKKFPQCLFFLAGKGKEGLRLRQKKDQERIENCFFLGFLGEEEMLAFWHRIDIFCLLSHREPFGLAVLEASHLGKPVIATPVGGIPEIIQHHKTGFLCEHLPEQEHALRQLIDHPELRKKMGAAGKIRAQHFSPDRYAKEMEEILFEN